jgi:RNA polymerase sigma factor (sigma-70 family)
MMATRKPRSVKTYSLKLEDNTGLIHLQAQFGFKWAKMNGHVLDYDDMVQIASIAFLKAVEGFDANAGVTFSAYFTKVAFSHFGREIGVMSGVKHLSADQRAEIKARKEENARRAASGQEQLPEVTYGLRPIPFSQVPSGLEDGEIGEPFESILASDALSPEDELIEREEREQAAQRAMSKLSPLAQLVVQWLQDPPPELLIELRKSDAYLERSREQGLRAYGVMRDGITIANIGRFLNLITDGAAKADFAQAQQELAALIEES